MYIVKDDEILPEFGILLKKLKPEVVKELIIDMSNNNRSITYYRECWRNGIVEHLSDNIKIPFHTEHMMNVQYVTILDVKDGGIESIELEGVCYSMNDTNVYSIQMLELTDNNTYSGSEEM